MKHPGRGGLTSDRLGDAEKWSPKQSDAADVLDSDIPLPERRLPMIAHGVDPPL
jgi:hypothetical protein